MFHAVVSKTSSSSIFNVAYGFQWPLFLYDVKVILLTHHNLMSGELAVVSRLPGFTSKDSRVNCNHMMPVCLFVIASEYSSRVTYFILEPYYARLYNIVLKYCILRTSPLAILIIKTDSDLQYKPIDVTELLSLNDKV